MDGFRFVSIDLLVHCTDVASTLRASAGTQLSFLMSGGATRLPGRMRQANRAA